MASHLERNSFAASTWCAAAYRWISEHNFYAQFSAVWALWHLSIAPYFAALSWECMARSLWKELCVWIPSESKGQGLWVICLPARLIAVSLYFSSWNRKNMCPHPFFINVFWIQVLHAGFVCFVLLTNLGFGGKPVLFSPYLFYLLKLSCSFFAFLCCDAHKFFLKQHSVILISAKRKRIYTWIHISKNTRELSKFLVSCKIIQKIRLL